MKHMHGSGIQYIIRPETFDRLSHSFSLHKGVDLALDPTEISASMLGGSIKQGISDAKKVSRYIGSVFKPLNKNLKPVKEAMTEAAVAQIQMQGNPNQFYLDQAKQVDAMLQPYVMPQAADGQVINSIASAATAAAVSNSFQPFAAPPTAVAPSIGTVTPVSHSRPTLASHAGYGMHFHMHGRGFLQAPGTPFHRLHPARLTAAYDTGFMQQIPQEFKDAARISAGRGVFL